MNEGRFVFQGSVPGDEVQPWHYRFEAECVRLEAQKHQRRGHHFEAAQLRAMAARLESVAERLNWLPSRLRSSALTERLRIQNRPKWRPWHRRDVA